MRWPGPLSLLVISEVVFPTASQTCSLWGLSKEKELEKCKGDLQSTDVEKIFCASSRIAKVTAGEPAWAARLVSWPLAISQGGGPSQASRTAQVLWSLGFHGFWPNSCPLC